MSSKQIFVITLLFWISSVICDKNICDLEDTKCLTEAEKRQFWTFIRGKEGLVESSDPLHVDLIEADLPSMKYTLTNATLVGLFNCQVIISQIFVKNMTYNYHIKCPHLVMESEYKLKGKIGTELAEGAGTCKLDFYDYNIILKGVYEKFDDENGKLHLIIKNHVLHYEAKDKVVYNFTNLFNGDKEKSDALHKYANENWELVHKLTRQPTMEAFMKKFIDNANAWMVLTPVEEYYNTGS